MQQAIKQEGTKKRKRRSSSTVKTAVKSLPPTSAAENGKSKTLRTRAIREGSVPEDLARVPPKALAVMDLIARGFLPPANEFSRITSEPLFTLRGVAALLDMKEEALTYLLLSRPPRFMVQRSKQSEYHPPAM